ncbi:MAG: L,D-transpeptidase family protein [Firmicutes bacterium]|nr:L,D-transpeptidase family protein [Bacillota bacterium]
MKKIVFALILSLMIQPFAFAEGEDVLKTIENDTEITEINEDEAKTDEDNHTETEEKTINLVNLYVFSNGIDLSSFPVFENKTLMLPIKEFLSHLGANDFSVNEENQITITYGKNIVSMHLDSTNANFNHEDTELSASPFLVGDIVYAPAEEVCKVLGFTFKSDTDGSAMSVYADLPENELASEKRVNSKDLPSDTQYLIWVNKSKYTVYVFLGKDKNWREIYSCKCSIGASDSPTITGVFKYISREQRWTYDDFYVGPIMRFHGGYAIHSTLLKFDGSNYNNTVGVKNSHGCVRVRPDNINWLVSYVPLKTTVYVSEN